MAIKIETLQTLPAIDVDHIQYCQFNMTIAKEAPYTISISASIAPYGTDANGFRGYNGEMLELRIPNLDAFIMGLAGQDQVDAILAMIKVQEGLGVLSEKGLDLTFMEYDNE